jgi:hypothetical protein
MGLEARQPGACYMRSGRQRRDGIAPVTNGGWHTESYTVMVGAARAASRVPCAWALCASCMRAPSCPQLNPLATPKLLLRCAGGDGDGDGYMRTVRIAQCNGRAPRPLQAMMREQRSPASWINIHGHGRRRL